MDSDLPYKEIKDESGECVLDYPDRERVGKYVVHWKAAVPGFKCIVTEWVSDGGTGEDETLHLNVMECRALSDGIRHLWMGEGCEHESGYFNYPELGELMQVLMFLHKLEIELTDKYLSNWIP